MSTIHLRQLAHARSGDKGNHANISVMAESQPAYDHLVNYLTVDVVQKFFAPLSPTKVERFELPNLWAMNFLLHNALAGGASQSLRTDTQGKLLGTAILDLPIPTFWPTKT